ncbi:4Fe-4S dicluster domain-containing protein [Candidatus Eisenbacteria bacterium]|uniref:4Fe-4S dicluster domain-containing protein n=1 Tax=Eiseniibacteriota bacterium TaxID=2212470 RepID=A0ABV6YKD3_UNCEI
MACAFQRDKEYSRYRSVIKLMKEEALGIDCPVTCITCCRCVKSCPEDALSLTSKGLIKLDSEKCTGCRTCERVCPVGVIEFDEAPLFCTNCGKCVKACNLRALSLAECADLPVPPAEKDVESLTPVAKRYRWVLGRATELPWVKEEDVRVYR